MPNLEQILDPYTLVRELLSKKLKDAMEKQKTGKNVASKEDSDKPSDLLKEQLKIKELLAEHNKKMKELANSSWQNGVNKSLGKNAEDFTTEALQKGVPAENILQQIGVPSQVPPTTPFTKSGITPEGNVQRPGWVTRVGQAGLTAQGAQDPNAQATNTQMQLLELLIKGQGQQQAGMPSDWDIHKEAENQALSGLGGSSWLGLDEEARKQYYPAILERENQIRQQFGKPPMPAMEYKDYLNKVRTDIKAKVDALEKPNFVNQGDWDRATAQQKKEFLNKLFGGK